jgi:hypothetical protein
VLFDPLICFARVPGCFSPSLFFLFLLLTPNTSKEERVKLLQEIELKTPMTAVVEEDEAEAVNSQTRVGDVIASAKDGCCLITTPPIPVTNNNNNNTSTTCSDTKRWRKRTPHRRIGFELMAKTIAKRWKEIEPQRLLECKQRAEEEKQRYQQEFLNAVTRTTTTRTNSDRLG